MPIIRRMTIFGILLFISSNLSGANSDIRISSAGFLPDAIKQASVIVECTTFQLKKSESGEIIFTGTISSGVSQDDVDQTVWIADFSGVSEPGFYFLEIPGVGRSIEFEIGETVYAQEYYSVMRGFYLWRCGTAVNGEHNGQIYQHDACHLEDAYQNYIPSGSNWRNGVGGWHDAGDYGKYTVNAGITLGSLFMAWDHFQNRLENIDLHLPETATGLPEFLDELKWETDWLLKMPYPDGSGRVSHKLTRLDFSAFIMPEDDEERRYFTVWSSAATADFAAIMAMASRYFRPYDPLYAESCLRAARRSYAYLVNHPEHFRFQQGDFSTGGYQTDDEDDRLWAAAEMWETTGEQSYIEDFEKMVSEISGNAVDFNWDWSDVSNLGMFTYALSEREGKSSEILTRIRADIIAVADSIVESAKNDVYNRPLGARYYWGCNGTVARQTMNLQVANMINPTPEYLNTALDAVGHLFGRNYYGRSYVTGLGVNLPMNPHDRRSGSDGIESPWPGYLVGGGHTATGWEDVEESYATNEIAINWQGALVYALAGFLSGR